MTDLSVGLIVAVVSMLGTLVALSVVAVFIAILHRLFPDSRTPGPEL